MCFCISALKSLCRICLQETIVLCSMNCMLIAYWQCHEHIIYWCEVCIKSENCHIRAEMIEDQAWNSISSTNNYQTKGCTHSCISCLSVQYIAWHNVLTGVSKWWHTCIHVINFLLKQILCTYMLLDNVCTIYIHIEYIMWHYY